MTRRHPGGSYPWMCEQKGIDLMGIPRKGTPEYEAWRNSPAYEEAQRRGRETRAKQMQNPEIEQRIREANKGRKQSEEEKAKRAASMRAFHEKNGDHLSPEARARVTAASKGRKRSAETRAKNAEITRAQWEAMTEEQRAEANAKRSDSLKAAREQRGGSFHTPESRAKISAANTGRKHSEEHRAKNAQAARARQQAMTDEQKAEINAKRNASLKARYEIYGDPLSPEARAKVTAAMKGRPPRIQSEAEKARLSTSLKAFHEKNGDHMSPEVRARVAASNRGRKASPETRDKNRAASRARWEAMADEQKAAKLEQLRAKSQDITDSTLERVVAAELDQQGIVYERQKTIGWYLVDFYLPNTNTIIEAAGCYWHGCEACGHSDIKGVRAKDAKRYEYLQQKGYTVQIIWEHERLSEIRALRNSRR